MQPRGLLEAAIYAEDLEAAERFYRDVVGLEVLVPRSERQVFFRVGEGVLLVFNPRLTASVETRVAGQLVPRHGAAGPGHVAFRVEDRELDAWRDCLREHGVAIESEIDWPRGGRSIYVRDPAGNSVEFATAALWHRPSAPE